MAQLDQNLCKQEKQKRKRTEMRENDKKEGKRVSSNQTHLHHNKNMFPQIPFCNPSTRASKKISIFIFAIVNKLKKKQIFTICFIIARLIWAFGALGLGQSFTEKTGKQKPSLSLSLSFSVTTLVFSFYYFLPISFSLPLSLNIFSLLKGFFLTVKKMKKMKGVVAADSSAVAALNAQARLKHQSLSQDYQELLKDTDAKRNRLHRVNQKKLTLSAEVGFLRRRYKYLLKNQSRNSLLKQDFVAPKILQPQPQHKNIVRRGIRDYNTNEGFELNQMERNDNVKEVALHCPPNLTENQRERIHNGKETALRYPIPATQRIYNGKEVALPHPALNNLNRRERIHDFAKAALRNPLPGFDVHQKERVCDAAPAPAPAQAPALFFIKNQKGPVQSGKEDAPRNFVRAFDLNQISVYN